MSTKKTPLAEPPAVGSSPDDGLFWETRVADSLGVSRDRLRLLREEHMKENTHFIMRRNAVVLTESGMELVKKILIDPTLTANASKVLPHKPVLAVAPFNPPTGPAPRQSVRVAKVPPNPRLLFCVPEDGGATSTAQFLVRVKTNENFMAGMTMEVISAGDGVWQYVGRLPRRKGRWL